MSDMEGSGDEDVECFDVNEDERTTALTYRFEVSPLPSGSNIVAPVGLICNSQDKFEDDEYVSGEFGSSGLDASDDDRGKGHKFEKFREYQLNKDYQFKWSMEFNSLADFRDAIRKWKPKASQVDVILVDVVQVDVGPGSNYDQPITLTERDEGTLTQKDITMVPDSKLGVCLSFMKS
ncbi:hypothetical protein KIW84_063064 [Lathyrus oleraceus]|uniref:Uncharacterized protein n=1 Tax=Pisum sativum TaxID=3888 RepID=A0A9D4W6P2_PEA|nr:hypothetical protein KIW84_063064 [Pisum sativum]